MENKFSKYFLAANSAEGFVSHFADCYDALDGWRAYIVKGGPGTGKSSFMKYVAIKAADMGYDIELCPCSSDPDSLDGVIIKELKTVLLDGTSPHVVEPQYAGVCEEIINLGEFWNTEKLRKKSSEIINVTLGNKKLHKTASAYISAAGEMAYDSYKLSKRFANLKKTEQFARFVLLITQHPLLRRNHRCTLRHHNRNNHSRNRNRNRNHIHHKTALQRKQDHHQALLRNR